MFNGGVVAVPAKCIGLFGLFLHCEGNLHTLSSPEIKEQSKRLVESGKLAQKEVTTFPLASMLLRLFNGIVKERVTFLERHISSLCKRFKNRVMRKRWLTNKEILLDNDNAPTHFSAVVVAKLWEPWIQRFPHDPTLQISLLRTATYFQYRRNAGGKEIQMI